MSMVNSATNAANNPSKFTNDASASILKKVIETTKATATAIIETADEPSALAPTGNVGTRLDIKM